MVGMVLCDCGRVKNVVGGAKKSKTSTMIDDQKMPVDMNLAQLRTSIAANLITCSSIDSGSFIRG